MARDRKRRTQWIDTVQTVAIGIVGAADPGTVSNRVIVAESELENLGGMATITRVVGTLLVASSAGFPLVSWVIWTTSSEVSSVRPTDWVQDTYQRQAVMATGMVQPSSENPVIHIAFDVRSQRKIGQGRQLELTLQNHSIASNDANFTFHTRVLLLL